MTAIPQHYASIAATGAAIRAGELSVVELTKAMLARISALDPKLKSFLTVTADQAPKQAAAAEAELKSGRGRGPPHGIPIAIKDLAYTKGIATSAGMAIHKNFVPDYDATVVARLAAAGSILFGKLHMTEGATLERHPELPPINRGVRICGWVYHRRDRARRQRADCASQASGPILAARSGSHPPAMA